jgi:Tfp pilus assembly protein PilP
MNKVGHKEDEGVLSYSDLEPKKSHFNCAGVVVQGVVGVLVHSGDYVLVDEIVARIVTVGDEQVEINECPRVVEDASKGWEPIKEDYLRLNQEVYQSR